MVPDHYLFGDFDLMIQFISVHILLERSWRRCGSVSADKREAKLCKAPVRSRVFGIRFTVEFLEAEVGQEVVRRQAKEPRAYPFLP